MKNGRVHGVRVSVEQWTLNVISIWYIPTKTDNHFGNTPIYGGQLNSGSNNEVNIGMPPPFSLMRQDLSDCSGNWRIGRVVYNID